MVTQTIRFAKYIFAAWIFVAFAPIFAGSARCDDAALPADAGFASPDQNLFAPVLMLAAPGPDRSARALDAFARQLAFQRKLSFHPELSPDLKALLEVLPP